MTETTPTGRFEWLREKLHRRGALLKVHNALLCGWVIDGDRRADLVRELNALLVADDLSGRERVRIDRIFRALDLGPPRRPRRPRRSGPVRPCPLLVPAINSHAETPSRRMFVEQPSAPLSSPVPSCPVLGYH